MESVLTTEELLAQHKNWLYNRTDRNGTRYFCDDTCKRCGGKGVIQYYAYVDGGVCYECGGSGRSSRSEIIKVYTPEHAAKLAAARDKREAERKAARLKDFEENWNTKLEGYGFGIEDGKGVCYRVVGNTYEIKDQLKELGCKFKSSLGWYAPRALEGYETQRMEADQIVTFNRDTLQVEWADDDTVKAMWIERTRAAEESPSVWVGEIGGKLTIKVHIDRVFESTFRAHAGAWGARDSYMYLMHDEARNVYKWSTAKCYAEGDDVTFKATVKDHTEYKGIKQTVLTRCTKVEA